MQNLMEYEGTSVPNGPARRRYLVLLRYQSIRTWQIVSESRHGVSYDDAEEIVAYNKRHNGNTYDSFAIIPILED